MWYIQTSNLHSRACSGLKLQTSKCNMNLASILLPPYTPPVVPTVKSPTTKLEPFLGDIESWPHFRRSFSHSVMHTHLFRMLTSMSFSVATSSECKSPQIPRKKQCIQHAKYGDKNCIIEAHLDYLEDLKLRPPTSPLLLNTTYVKCDWLYKGLHGFRLGYSCGSQVITVCQDIVDSLDNYNWLFQRFRFSSS